MPRYRLPALVFYLVLFAVLVLRTLPLIGSAPAVTAPRPSLDRQLAPRHLRWSSAVASSYSAASTGSTRQGCPGSPSLRDSARSMATFLVRCGRRMRVCHRRRCVTVTRWDSGPFVAGRSLDLNVGVVRELGFASAQAWGVRPVRWQVLR